MPITHILVIVDDEEGINDMINVLGMIDLPHEAALLVTDTVQSAINLLAVDCDDVSFNRKLNG
jgi:hypothetical protein